jgi:putative hydrolases of HD superfamily
MRFALPVLLALLAACSSTELVSVPPRMELQRYEVLGIIEFDSNADAAINAHATRQLQEHIQSAQPGARFIELGNRETVLASVGARQLDAVAARRIGSRYGVAAFFVGELAYAEPKADLRISDVTKLDGSVHAELRGDISAKLQPPAGKADQERRDLLRLTEPLPPDVRARLVALWDEYEAGSTPEARVVKALDKLETILQHNQGRNPPSFDYAFNLTYGARQTTVHPLTVRIRAILDAETAGRA